MNGDVLLFRRVLLQAPSWKISLQGISNIMRKLYYIVYTHSEPFFCFPIYTAGGFVWCDRPFYLEFC